MTESQSWWRASTPPSPDGAEGTSVESKIMEIPPETESEKPLTRRVHIMGVGSIGSLIAHSLRSLPNPPPVSLLMHKPEIYKIFKTQTRTIRLINPNTEIDDEQRGYDVDVLEVDDQTELPYWRYVPDEREKHSTQPTNPLMDGETTKTGEVYIYTIIVTVKGPATILALASIKHRLNQHSTICLMQNGMGQIDELNRLVFTDPATRPTYMLGIISHGAYMSRAFNVVHAGFGAVSLGIHRDTDKYPLPPKSPSVGIDELSEEDRSRMYPSDEELYKNLSSRYLLRTLTRSPVLTCAPFPYLELFQLQLEKLAMNAVLNPLTALLNIPNGFVIGAEPLTQVERLLLAEISLVIRNLPELEGIPGVKKRFSAQRLEILFTNIAKKTAKNSSSMREDIRHLRPTEINYINGYIVKRGEEQGIKPVLNYMIMQLIKGLTMVRSGKQEILPYGTTSIQALDSHNHHAGNTGDESGVTEEGLDVSGPVTLDDVGTPVRRDQLH